MSRGVKPFPVIDEQILDSLDFNIDDKFNNGDLTECPAENEIILIDNKNENCLWQFNFGDLSLSRSIIINNPKILFGKNGVACTDAVLGVGIQWSSTQSRTRGCYEITQFDSNFEKIDFSINQPITFTRNSLLNYLNLQTIIYIKKAGTPTDEEMFLANDEGIILGELDFKKIRLDGNASELPIFDEDVSSSTDPLWKVLLNIDNPHENMFVDSFQIFLNKNNPSYNRVNRNLPELYDSHLMDEIVASALSMLVSELRTTTYWKEIEDNDSKILDGSTSSVVHHFIDKLNINTKNTITINESFRKLIENHRS